MINGVEIDDNVLFARTINVTLSISDKFDLFEDMCKQRLKIAFNTHFKPHDKDTVATIDGT